MLKFLWAVILAAFGMLFAQAMLLGALIGARHATVLNGELQLGTMAGTLIVAMLLGGTSLFQKLGKSHIVWAAILGLQAVPGLALTLRFIADRGVTISEWVTLPTIGIPAQDVLAGRIIVGAAAALLIIQRLLKRPAEKPAAVTPPKQKTAAA